MRGLIYLPGLDKLFSIGKHLGTILKVGFVVGVLSTTIYLAVASMNPVTQATEKANKVIAQEKEVTLRLCVRDANNPGAVQTCKDRYIDQYR